jgi:hypothetical protein
MTRNEQTKYDASAFMEAWKAAMGEHMVTEDLANFVEHKNLTRLQRRMVALALRTLQKPLPWRPALENCDLGPVQAAQHDAAYNVMLWRQKHCKENGYERIKSSKTAAKITEEMAKSANKLNVPLSQMSATAVRNIIKNKRAKQIRSQRD